MLTTQEVLQRELRRILVEQEGCISEHGIVMNKYKRRYQELVRSANDFRNSIEWLQNNTNVQ